VVCGRSNGGVFVVEAGFPTKAAANRWCAHPNGAFIH
jgi:hypothetical protein